MPNVRLPDGRLVFVPDQDYQSVVAGGAVPETTDEAVVRATEDANRIAYDTPLDKAKALGEGALSGLTFGGSDWLLNSEDAQNRAKYDGGWRTAGELGGMVLPALAGMPFGAASIAADTGEMAANAARGLGGLASKAVGRAAEGALYGLGAANSHAAMSDDPLTVESFLASAGTGAIFNIGLGAMADGLISRGAKASEAIANEAKAIEQGRALEQAAGKYSDILNVVKNDLRAAEQDLARKVAAIKPVRAAGVAAEGGAVGAEASAIPEGGISANEGVHAIKDHYAESMARLRQLKTSMRFTPGAVPSAIDTAAIRKAGDDTVMALVKGDGNTAAKGATRLRQLVTTAEQDHAFDMAAANGTAEIPPEVPPTAPVQPTGAPKPPPTPLDLKQAHQNLKATMVLPKSLNAFVKAGPEQLAAAEKVLSPQALEKLTKLADDLGIKAKPGQVLQDLKTHIEDLAKLERRGSAAAKEGTSGLLRRAVRFGAGAAFGKYSHIGAIGGTLLSAALGQAKAAVSGSMDAIIAKIGVPLGKALGGAAPALSRVATSKLIGNHGPDVRQRAAQSIVQAHAAAYSAPDAYYHAVKPFIESGNPALAAKLQQSGVADAAYLAAKAPKDPGLSKAMGKTQWVPSDAQAREHNTRVWTLNNEMAAIEHLASGRPDMIMAKTLWDRRPALMHEFQARVLANFEAIKNAPYPTRNALSAVLGIPLDTLNAPQYIAKMAAMDAPSEAAANPGSASSAGSSAKSKPKPQTMTDRLTNQGS